MAQQTADLRSTADIKPNEVAKPAKPRTGPGMMGALAVAEARIQELEAKAGQVTVPIAQCVPNPWQPRKSFDPLKLSELAESVRVAGLLQPILVRRSAAGYEIIAGERRWRACQMLGWVEIPALVSDCSDEEMAVFALLENVDREDLSDYEISISVRRAASEFPEKKKMATALGMSRSALYQYLAYEKLPDFIQRDLESKPRLLGSTAAEAVVSAIRSHGEKGHAAARSLWTLVVGGSLDQSKFAAAIKSQATRGETSSPLNGRSIDKFFAGKEHAGSITKDGSGLTVKFKSGVLTEAQETQIRQLIGDMFSMQGKLQ
ncbi:ParB/RepB/Spo0J family partition protein [Ralstonia soli]|uniref:ParB/RepB/Spo0J family partition protein n=1 Tax=Ralstonia soli TaxID=2953896 RepID=A0ABT1AE96_9RALS|nr:ParB/RepB/Spo0J family partition protein [Ralstonia soli]MCO5396654.1 ParB/RepB/Spo0J family partition protein [Ralstonia soli]